MKNQFVRDNMRNIIASRLMVSWRVYVSVLTGVYFVLILVGCAWIGLMRSEDRSFTGKDSILLQVSTSDILDIVAEVGKSMGYSVSDKEANIIRLSSSSSMFDEYLKGKMSRSTLRISSINDGKELEIDVFVSGNFGTGGQEAAMKLVNDFKARFLESDYIKSTARMSERIQEKEELDKQLAGEIKKEPSVKQKPEAPKTEAVSSTPSTFTQKEALAAPPPPSIPAPEETKATSTTPSILTSKEDKADKPSSPPLSGKKLVCIKTANVRAAASTKGKIIKILKKGDEVEYLGNSGNWINVKLSSGAIGWVFNDLLKSR